MKENKSDNMNFLQYANSKIRGNAVWEMVEMRIASISPGEVEMSLEIKDKHLNLMGICHGGIIATLADTAMGVALYAKEAAGATIEMNINFMEPLRKGDRVLARGRVLRKGKTTAVTTADLWVGDKMVATARGTYFIMENANNQE
ncbi:MAG: hypothetical protein HPY66_1173 [Firmicutes bacterium]|nr:hypothetical protein [Bacillota bacterium]MDI6705505.1 PaaI family thioesterase [Bacillota bacterium]